MKPKTLAVLAAVVILSLIGWRVAGIIKSRRAASAASQSYPVEVLVVAPMDFDQTLSVTGTVMAENQTEVYPKVPGKIIRYLYAEGAWVERGQTVVTIDRDEVGAEYQEAVVEAPISGWLTRKYFDTGAHVAPGMPLLQLADYRRVNLVASVPETELGKVKRGAPAKAFIDAWPDMEFAGYIKTISPAVDQMSRTVKVEIALQNPGLRLRPGMYGRAEVMVERHRQALAVPSEAVIETGGFPKVFIVNGGRARAREVKVSAQSGDRSLIQSGLSIGDTLIVAGQYSVVDGVQVEIVGGR